MGDHTPPAMPRWVAESVKVSVYLTSPEEVGRGVPFCTGRITGIKPASGFVEITGEHFSFWILWLYVRPRTGAFRTAGNQLLFPV